jgi:RNA polymerase sigma factor (sigma-70 family)
VREGSEGAFREIVERHAGLVLGIARRKQGDDEAARDVAQNVFALLARKASSLLGHPSLAGWLFTVCRYECQAMLRRERLHRERLQQYAAADGVTSPDTIRPLLDEAMENLSAADREVLLWRYYDEQEFAAIAARRGSSEPTVRKQVSRALERLGVILRGRGAVASAAALTSALSAEYAQAQVLVAVAGRISRAALKAGAGVSMPF